MNLDAMSNGSQWWIFEIYGDFGIHCGGRLTMRLSNGETHIMLSLLKPAGALLVLSRALCLFQTISGGAL